MGVAYVRKQMWSEAEGVFRELLKLDPDSVEGHFNLGVVYEKQGKNTEAAKEYERAIALNAGLLQARQGLDRVRP
jgi:Tfp pilus assembly protein PilF